MTRKERNQLARRLDAARRCGRMTDCPGLRARITWLRNGPDATSVASRPSTHAVVRAAVSAGTLLPEGFERR